MATRVEEEYIDNPGVFVVGCIMHTSVSIANPGFQSTGGMILQIPYCDASGAIFFIYTNGSLNSSIVGRYVGASCRPCGRIFLAVSLLAVGWPRRSTLDRSSGADLMALRCTGAGALPFAAAPFARVEAALLLVAALAGEARAADEPPLVVGTCTIFMQSPAGSWAGWEVRVGSRISGLSCLVGELVYIDGIGAFRGSRGYGLVGWLWQVGWLGVSECQGLLG